MIVVVEGTTSHKVYKREKGKFKHGENVLLGELLKGQLHFLQLKDCKFAGVLLYKGWESKLKACKTAVEQSGNKII